MAGSTKMKTLNIKNFKGISTMDEVYFENQCKTLKLAILAILKNTKIHISYEELYQIVINVKKVQKHALQDIISDLLQNYLLEKLEYLTNKEKIMEDVKTTWILYNKHIQVIKNIFLNLDKSSKNKNNTINLLGLNLFKTLILQNPLIKNKLTKEIFEQIRLERHGEVINLEVLESLISMFTELQVYDDMFQTEFLNTTETFYIQEGILLIQKLKTSDYLKHVNNRILEEQSRGHNYLNKYTAVASLQMVYKYLIQIHVEDILNNGFDILIDSIDNFNELSLLYNLLKKIAPGLKLLGQYFLKYIIKEGTEIVNNQEKDMFMIQRLLEFKQKMDNIVRDCFKGNDDFNEIIRTAFVKFINIRKNKPAQLLATFLDKKMRSKDLNEANLELLFDKVMVLFRFIQGKDIFEAFYKRDLSKRLLLDRSTSQDSEDSMIARLKNECGDNFTSKIEGMFKDITISQSINTSFKQHLKIDKIDLSFNVLTSSFWPNYQSFQVNLPEDLASYQQAFQKFYSSNHSGKKLIWQPNLGTCILKANFDQGNKEFQLSLFQTIVLLLFDKAASLTFKEIRELTNLEETELKKTLLSLACGKVRVLLKNAKGIDLKNTDTFIVNQNFTSKLFRVKINQVQLKETPEEQQNVETNVMVDRQFQIDAAIVRIMKKKMTISHNTLLGELLNTLNIPVKPYDLKKRIELLIEREYMEREKDNPANYVYIA